MKISIISIGKFENSPHKQVFQNYLKRSKWKVELKELELRNSHNLSVEKIKEGEALGLHPVFSLEEFLKSIS